LDSALAQFSRPPNATITTQQGRHAAATRRITTIAAATCFVLATLKSFYSLVAFIRFVDSYKTTSRYVAPLLAGLTLMMYWVGLRG